MKKFFVFLLVALSVITGVFAAGGKEANEPAKADTAKELVYLNSHGNVWDGEIGEEIFKAFYDKYGIRVRSVAYPFNQYMELVEVKMKSKDSDYDILNVDAPLVASYSIRNYLAPYEDFVDRAHIESSFTRAGVSAATYQGKIMTVPKRESGMVMVYNKDILDRHGIPYPDKNGRMTWEECKALAAQCVEKKNGSTVVWGLVPDQINRAWNVMPIANSNGATWLSEDGFKATGYLDSEKSIEAMKFYQSWFEEGIAPRGLNVNEVRELFDAGSCAFIFGDPVCYARAVQRGLNVGFCRVPAFENGTPAIGCDSWHIGINNYSKHKEEAALFIRFITEEEGADMFLDSQSNLGCCKRRINELIETTNPDTEVYSLLASELDYGVGRPKTPGFNEWADVVDNVIEDIRNGADVKKSLSDGAQKIDGLLKKYSR